MYPKGWASTALGDIAPANSNHLPPPHAYVWNLSLDEIEPGTGRVLRKAQCKVAQLGSAKCSFDSRHVLYSKLRPYLNKVVLPDEPGVGTSELIPLLPDPARLDREYLAYYLRSGFFLDYANAHTRGANLPRIAMQALWNHRIPYPMSLDEQRRIVLRIKECLERVEEIQQLDVTVNVEALALFPALLNEQFRSLALSADPKRLDELADIRGGASLPKGHDIDSGSTSVLLLKVGDMNRTGNERIIASSRAYLPIAQAGRGVINAGATIFPKRGGAIATNKKRLLGRPALLDPNLMAIEPLDDLVLPGYLYYWSLTLDLREIASGAIIPQLNRKDLAPLRLPVPDRRAQEMLVTELEEAEAACAELTAHVRASHDERVSLREAILRKAFAGEL